jgi:hypothetical protein
MSPLAEFTWPLTHTRFLSSGDAQTGPIKLFESIELRRTAISSYAKELPQTVKFRGTASTEFPFDGALQSHPVAGQVSLD